MGRFDSLNRAQDEWEKIGAQGRLLWLNVLQIPQTGLCYLKWSELTAKQKKVLAGGWDEYQEALP